MITDTVLQATSRDERGKNAARRLRAAGRIPVSVYGEGLDAVAVSVNARDLGAILRSESGRHAIFTLAVEGGDESPVKIQELNLDPVSNRLVHLDLMRISLTEKTTVSVPLSFVGEPASVKQNEGMLEVHLHEIEIECLPRDIPGHIDVDVSNLEIGDHLTVAQIPVDTDVITVVTGEDHLVAAVTALRVIEEEVAEEPVVSESAPSAEEPTTEA